MNISELGIFSDLSVYVPNNESHSGVVCTHNVWNGFLILQCYSMFFV